MKDVISFYSSNKISELENDVGYVTQATVIVDQEMPNTWDTTSINSIVDSVRADDTAIAGKSYIGTVYSSGLPSGMTQAELKIEITKETGSGKVIVLTIISEDTSPYHWERVDAFDRYGIWRTFVPEDNAVKPLVISGLPDASIDTVAKLEALGFTVDEIYAASQGKRTGVIYNGKFYAINSVTYTSNTNYVFRFSSFALYKLPPEVEDDTIYYDACEFYSIKRNGNYVGCNATTIPANNPV